MTLRKILFGFIAGLPKCAYWFDYRLPGGSARLQRSKHANYFCDPPRRRFVPSTHVDFCIAASDTDDLSADRASRLETLSIFGFAISGSDRSRD